MPTKSLGCCAFARTPASPTMPIARPFRGRADANAGAGARAETRAEDERSC